MKVALLNEKGEKISDINLEKRIFGIVPNEEVLALYVRYHQLNKRQGTARVKSRGEVSGGGRKPWRQKGTGRARQGSIRAPQWVGGGVVHGPKPKDWSIKMPKKMRVLALFGALSEKAKGGRIVVLDDFKLSEIKTRKMVDIFKSARILGKEVSGKSVFFIPHSNEVIFKSSRNISSVNVSLVDNINAYEVLDADSVVFLKSSLDILYKTYLK